VIFVENKHKHARRAKVILFLESLRDRSIHGTVYGNELVNLKNAFGCDVPQERNLIL